MNASDISTTIAQNCKTILICINLLLLRLLSKLPPVKKVFNPLIRTTSTAIIANIAKNFKVFSDIRLSVA